MDAAYEETVFSLLNAPFTFLKLIPNKPHARSNKMPSSAYVGTFPFPYLGSFQFYRRKSLKLAVADEDISTVSNRAEETTSSS
jgi:hypothetical protein